MSRANADVIAILETKLDEARTNPEITCVVVVTSADNETPDMASCTYGYYRQIAILELAKNTVIRLMHTEPDTERE